MACSSTLTLKQLAFSIWQLAATSTANLIRQFSFQNLINTSVTSTDTVLLSSDSIVGKCGQSSCSDIDLICSQGLHCTA
ncbi:hypothetical protein CSQ79_14580 [Gloeocapsopsis sp. IPPAS B-1203]|nr:hypothetical protein CSQ79_14580 [Gloeocapsopsis sp. IPPAS B-1203]